jgi:RNA polymerase sigma factor (sigma-70 family)
VGGEEGGEGRRRAAITPRVTSGAGIGTTRRRMSEHERLVAAAQAGDREALGHLLVLHRAQVLATCSRMLGDPMLAEEAYQEASVTALLNLDLLRRRDRFGAWFTGIALNVCRRVLRERRHERLVADPPTAGDGDVEVDAMAALEATRVRDAVARLPVGQREAVLLYYLDGLTQAEVAAQLGIAVGAVKARLHKARIALKDRLITHREAVPMTAPAAPQHIDMTVDRVQRFRRGDREYHILSLTDAERQRRLPIWIGRAEAMSIALQVEKIAAPRPMTAALAANLVAAAGGSVREIRIERLDDTVFYAVVVVEGAGGVREVDARPSDAINLALLTERPILVSTAVLRASEEMRDAQGGPLPYDEVVGSAEIGAEAMRLLRPPLPPELRRPPLPPELQRP